MSQTCSTHARCPHCSWSVRVCAPTILAVTAAVQEEIAAHCAERHADVVRASQGARALALMDDRAVGANG